MFRRWRQWLRSPKPLKTTRVVVYTRTNCPLCDHAAEFLEQERRQLGFSLKFVDVDHDPALQAAHGNWVPVIEVNGKPRFRGRINPVLWHRLIAALRRG